MDEKDISVQGSELGATKIADEVVSIIAGLAAIEVKGIAGMSGGLVGGIAEMLGRKNLTKGVKVQVGEKEAAVDLYIIVEYGIKIPDLAQEIQTNVKDAIERMTGLRVVEVNVHVQGVVFQDNSSSDAEEAPAAGQPAPRVK